MIIRNTTLRLHVGDAWGDGGKLLDVELGLRLGGSSVVADPALRNCTDRLWTALRIPPSVFLRLELPLLELFDGCYSIKAHIKIISELISQFENDMKKFLKV